MDRSLDEVDVRLGADDDHLQREDHYSSGRRPHDERERSGSLENRGRSRSPRGRPSGGDIESGPRGSGNKRVYVSNLHYDVKSKDLKTVFRRVGPIVWATVKEVREGVSKGCGLVEYADEESAQKAIRELDGMKLLGRAVRVREDYCFLRCMPTRVAVSSDHQIMDTGVESFEYRREIQHRRSPLRPTSPSCNVFVSNLEYGVGWQKLKDIFKVAGRVSNVEVFTDKSGRSKGTAMVQFEDPGSAHDAIALFHGQMLQDRPMIVKMDRRAGITPDPLALRLDRLSQMSGFSSNYGGGDSYGGSYRDQRDYSNQRYSRDYGSSSRDYRDTRGDYRDTRGDYRDTRGDYRDQREYDRYNRSADYSQNRYSSDRYDRQDRFEYGRSGDYGGHRQDGSSASSYSILGPPPPIPPSPRHAPKTDRQLFVTNISFRSTWQTLKDHFKRAGRVDHVDVLTAADGRPRGCGTVLLSTKADASRAIDLLSGSELDGRRIDVKYDKFA